MSIPNEKKACISDGMLCEYADIEAFFLYQMIHGNEQRVTTKRHEWRKARASFVPFGFWGASASAVGDGGRRPLNPRKPLKKANMNTAYSYSETYVALRVSAYKKGGELCIQQERRKNVEIG